MVCTYTIKRLKDELGIGLGDTISIKVITVSSQPAGQSDPSTEPAQLKLMFKPLAPSNMESRAVNTNLEKIGIYWQPPTLEGQQGSPITAYKLEWCKAIKSEGLDVVCESDFKTY